MRCLRRLQFKSNDFSIGYKLKSEVGSWENYPQLYRARDRLAALDSDVDARSTVSIRYCHRYKLHHTESTSSFPMNTQSAPAASWRSSI